MAREITRPLRNHTRAVEVVASLLRHDNLAGYHSAQWAMTIRKVVMGKRPRTKTPTGPEKNMNKNRMLAIDVLRGFALWGILVMNIQGFALPSAAYFNPYAYGDFSGLNQAIWIFTRLFFDVKFLSIFSTLFGASLVLAGGGREGQKRLIWLIIFGLR